MHSRQRLAARALTEPALSRLSATHPHRAAVLAAHGAALAAGEAFYCDPASGLWVLTAAFLANRGVCCGRGCRHCPYLDGDATELAAPAVGGAVGADDRDGRTGGDGAQDGSGPGAGVRARRQDPRGGPQAPV